MKKLTVNISDALHARLTAVARRRKMTRETLVRKSLEAASRERGRPRRLSALHLVRDLAGSVEGPVDLSVNKAHFKGFGRQ